MYNSSGNSALPPNQPANNYGAGNGRPGAMSRPSVPGVSGMVGTSTGPQNMPYRPPSGPATRPPSGPATRPPSGPMPQQNIASSPVLPPPEPQKISSDPEVEGGGASSQLPVGMKIDDRYEIQGVLGTGGFATVYRAHHLTIDRDVALKVMDMKKGVDPSYSERFFREAKIAAKIHHNNVVSVYDFGHISETGQPYIAMEMLHGHDLSHELEKVGPLSPKRMFVLFRPVLEALGEGHRLGIVHKDLKPENLYLIDPGGARELMKVLDFGVARVNSSEVAKLTTAGQLLGTPRYLAPEYIKTQKVTPAIDVYQMALIISEALTGVPAASGDPFHAMMLHCSGRLQIAEFLLEGRVGEVFRRAISINDEERYSDCYAFAEALDSIADCFSSTVPLKGGAPQMTPGGNSNVSSMPFGSGQSTGTLQPSVMLSGVMPEAVKPPSKKRSIIIAIISVLTLALLTIIGSMVSDQKKPEESKPVADVVAEANFDFRFESDPPGAAVQLRGTEVTLCNTVCNYTFKSSELPASVIISKEGYQPLTLELSEFVFKKAGGIVGGELVKLAADPKKLSFLINIVPQKASVSIFEDGKENIVCKRSPCAYAMDASKGVMTLTVSAPGYTAQNIVLSEEEYNKNSTIDVVLAKGSKRQQAAQNKDRDNDKDKETEKEVEKPKPKGCPAVPCKSDEECKGGKCVLKVAIL